MYVCARSLKCMSHCYKLYSSLKLEHQDGLTLQICTIMEWEGLSDLPYS